jgi:hypothetical protein
LPLERFHPLRQGGQIERGIVVWQSLEWIISFGFAGVDDGATFHEPAATVVVELGDAGEASGGCHLSAGSSDEQRRLLCRGLSRVRALCWKKTLEARRCDNDTSSSSHAIFVLANL